MEVKCVVCLEGKGTFFKNIDSINYFQCINCESLFACEHFLKSIDTETKLAFNYSETYWSTEIKSSKERAFGSSLQRVAETLLYCRIPVKRFIDIGSGPGYLLDALMVLLPSHQHVFYGIEKFPPLEQFRTKNPNYNTVSFNIIDKKFSAGVCIEVIEHMTPTALKNMLEELAFFSEDKALYLFNSGQPEFVIKEDPNYLDPLDRGHIVSYSLKGLKKIFLDKGFNLIPLPGRSWAFLAEYNAQPIKSDIINELFNRIWNPVKSNKELLQDSAFGSLMYNIGIDSARCYLEHATANERTKWALRLQGIS